MSHLVSCTKGPRTEISRVFLITSTVSGVLYHVNLWNAGSWICLQPMNKYNVRRVDKKIQLLPQVKGLHTYILRAPLLLQFKSFCVVSQHFIYFLYSLMDYHSSNNKINYQKSCISVSTNKNYLSALWITVSFRKLFPHLNSSGAHWNSYEFSSTHSSKTVPCS